MLDEIIEVEDYCLLHYRETRLYKIKESNVAYLKPRSRLIQYHDDDDNRQRRKESKTATKANNNGRKRAIVSSSSV